MASNRYMAVISCASLVLMGLTGLGCWGLWQNEHSVVVIAMWVDAALLVPIIWYSINHDGGLGQAQSKRALLVILTSASLMRLLLVFPPPVSTDIFRYIWDGRVQAAGINPYSYRPADSALKPLRDQAIYPGINRAETATTIYPPMAQVIFFAVTRIAENVTAMKLAMAGFDFGTILILIRLLRRRDLPATRVLLYAWHPLPLFEFAGSGHIDAAAIFFMLAACLGADKRRPGWAGLLLGAATLVKYFPAVIFPTLYRRWDWRLPTAMLATIIVLYLPYISVGWQVLGFLPGYAQEEKLADGSGFFVLGLLAKITTLPSWAPIVYLLMGVIVLGLLALRSLLRPNTETPSLAMGLLLLTVFTLFVSPHLPWYFAAILPLLCFRPYLSLLYLTGAAPVLYGIAWQGSQLACEALLYVPFVILFALEMSVRSGKPLLEVSDGSRFEYAATH